jgi:hypothetical protein
VFSNPKPGQDAAYNAWYDDIHLPDVLAVPGVRSAERYRISAPGPDAPKQSYLAIYELTQDHPAVLAEMAARVESGQMVISDSFDKDNVVVSIYEPI